VVPVVPVPVVPVAVVPTVSVLVPVSSGLSPPRHPDTIHVTATNAMTLRMLPLINITLNSHLL
jgi:hypothetical protein